MKDGKTVKTFGEMENSHCLIDFKTKISLTDEMKIRFIGKKDMGEKNHQQYYY